MCEVTEKNFESKFDDIANDLYSASFISIDCEFSGLSDGVRNKSLFDSAKARFNKLQKNLGNLLIIQMGLSAFKYNRDENTFTVSSYSFYLMPTPYLKNFPFRCHSKSIDFLCKHNFDFNKLYYEGISFWNISQEEECLKIIEEGISVDVYYRNKMVEYCLEIAKWGLTTEYGSEIQLEINERDVFVYILHQKLRRVPEIWTFFVTLNSKILGVRKVKQSEKLDLLKDTREEEMLKKKLFDSISGFSRVLKILESMKKPIVGHNMLYDLIMIYKQFYNPSPVSYEEFKKNISKIFPNIYDTKRLSFELKFLLPNEHCWESNNLQELYYYLKSGKGANLVLFSPLVQHNEEEFLKEEKFHDAGFDSYCTGFCFIKIAHIFCMWDKERKSSALTKKTLISSWYLSGIKTFKNHVNLARAQVNYICLDKKDPKERNLTVLFFRSTTGQAVDFNKMFEAITKFSSADIQPFNKYSGLVILASHKPYQEIINCFKDNKDIELTKYNFFKHSTSGRVIISSVIGTTVILITLGVSKYFFLNK